MRTKRIEVVEIRAVGWTDDVKALSAANETLDTAESSFFSWPGMAAAVEEIFRAENPSEPIPPGLAMMTIGEKIESIAGALILARLFPTVVVDGEPPGDPARRIRTFDVLVRLVNVPEPRPPGGAPVSDGYPFRKRDRHPWMDRNRP